MQFNPLQYLGKTICTDFPVALLVSNPEDHLWSKANKFTPMCEVEQSQDIFGKRIRRLGIVIDLRCECYMNMDLQEVSFYAAMPRV